MTTRATTREIDFSTFPESDGEPMAETFENMTQMIDLMFALRRLLRKRGLTRVAVGGNQFLYYNPDNGRDHCSPDVYVALDVPPGGRPTWKTWLEGKCPDVVFEITSPSTQDEDLGPKRTLYARLGAREYYIYDPQGTLFLGYELREGRMEPLQYLPSGGIASPLLEAELRPVDQYLRVIDLQTDQSLPTVGEIEDWYETSQMLLDREAQARQRAEWQAAIEEQARREAEEHAAREAEARQAAEERARQAEEALRDALTRLQERGPAEQ
jgi:Uma2 family endonuclease